MSAENNPVHQYSTHENDHQHVKNWEENLKKQLAKIPPLFDIVLLKAALQCELPLEISTTNSQFFLDDEDRAIVALIKKRQFECAVWQRDEYYAILNWIMRFLRDIDKSTRNDMKFWQTEKAIRQLWFAKTMAVPLQKEPCCAGLFRLFDEIEDRTKGKEGIVPFHLLYAGEDRREVQFARENSIWGRQDE